MKLTLSFLSVAIIVPAFGFNAITFENPADADQTPRYLVQTTEVDRVLQTETGNLPDIIADDNLCKTYGEFSCLR
jgi:hypothetical protein